MAAGTTQATQGELQFLGLLHGMGLQQIVQAGVGNDKGQAVEEFEALLAEGAGGTKVHHPERGLVHELQGQAGRRGRRGKGRPSAVSRSQVPRRKCSGASSQRPTRLPEILSARSWRTPRSRLRESSFSRRFLAQGAKGFEFHGGALGVELIEFFFAARTER